MKAIASLLVSMALWDVESPMKMRRCLASLWKQAHCKGYLASISQEEGMTSKQYTHGIATSLWGGRPECCVLT